MTSYWSRLRAYRWLLTTASLAVLLAPVSLGCHSLAFLRQKDKAADKIDPSAAAPIAALTLPSKYQVRVAPYVFLSDFEVPRDQPLFKELGGLRDQVHKELLLPPGTTAVQVYLFEGRDRYEQFMKAKHPALPTRRAFFVAQPRSIGGTEDLLVYTYWGKRIRQDLRHELTHAVLHSVIKDVPQWLDEGLAEYFELATESKGINAAHVETLRRSLASGQYRLGLDRLERLKEVDEMSPAEYREAWAWVHLMLHSHPDARTVLLSYLQQLRGSKHPGSLRAKLEMVFNDPEQALADHLATLERDLARDRVQASRPIVARP